MEIILSSNCESFTGSLGRGFGYSIQRRKNRFFAKRNSKGTVPPDGHWRFIVACADLAKAGLHISDIKVSRDEVNGAIKEAKTPGLYLYRIKDVYDADDILTIKSKCGL